MAKIDKIIKAAKAFEQAAIEAGKAKPMNARPPKDVPPLERAPAKSKKELEEIAQRVAPQITGEFVKGKTSANILGMSKKRFELEKELEHDIRQTEDPSELKMFDYPSYEGSVQVGVFGDPTISGKAIHGVAGKGLPRKSEQFGGPHYNLYHPEDAWASEWGAAAGLQNLAYDASHQYGGVPVVGMYTKMGPAAYGHAQHLNDAIMMNIVNELPNMSKAQIDAFNTLVRNNPKAKDFAGIEHPEISLAQMTENSEMRKQFYNLAIQPTLTERLSMPNGLDVVHAALDPDLRYLETGITGHSVVELDPTIRALKPAAHPTYDTRIPRKAGTDVMQTEVPIPYELQYPDQLLSIGKNPRQAPQPFGTLMMSGARQIIDPQHIDEISLYRDFIKKYTGKAKGGLAMAGGGKVGALEKIMKAASEISKEAKLPAPENAARTQIAGTKPTYDKARELLKLQGVDKNIIDYGAGKGVGSYGWADTYEPYAQGWYPTYTKAEDIPSDKYSGLLNLNVLNVLPPELRAEAIENMGRVLEKGGKGLVTTRGRDVMNALAGGRPGPEPMSVITSWDTYQKGFTGQELEDELRRILGKGFDVDKINLGPAGAKIQKKAEGGIMEPASNQLASTFEGYAKSAKLLKELATKYYQGIGEDVKNLDWNAIRDIPSNIGADILGLPGDLAKAAFPYGTGVYAKGIEDQPSKLGSQRIKEGMKNVGITSGKEYPFIEGTAEVFPGTTLKAVKGASNVAKSIGRTALEQGAKNIAEGRLVPGLIVNPRMNIIKDPGGMVVGGEKVLDTELLNMKKNEALNVDMTNANTLPEMFARREAAPKDPNAVALNQWIDTKVRKYIRNQAGTESDPILKAIESGVEHKFSPAIGDTKYYVRHKRELIGKPVEGIAKTDLGKEWEYKVDSTFTPKKSADIKEILNMPMEHLDSPAVRDRRRASMLRVEQDLPIHDEKDLEALKLINQIPDENVYTIDVSSLTNRLGLNHVSDVLYEDLQTGRLRPEQLNQMSIEKAIRRTAEYDAEKAKAMTKAHATSIEGMPIPKEYNDGYKWVELKHETDPKKTAAALKSEGEMMGHCVGGYCPNVESGEIKIFSLRGPDGKSHVTIEARPQISMTLWRNANMDLISRDPELMKLDVNMRSLDNDDKYGRQMTESDYIRIMTKEMKQRNIRPVEPPSYMELHQVKGKQNKRPDEKYQSYISDFIKNNPTKHEIANVHELDNTNLMSLQNVYDTGLVDKDLHNHPEVEKILKMLHPELFRADNPKIPKAFSRSEELKYDLFKRAAEDIAKQSNGKFFLEKDDILNHLREKYLSQPHKKNGGVIQLKIPSLRRKYG